MPRSKFSVTRLTKKFMTSVFQMLGIMLTLVGANLLTARLTPVVPLNSQQQDESINLQHIEVFDKNNSVEICNSNDFGCNRWLCWRTCVVHENNEQGYDSWCFAAPEKEQKKSPSLQESCRLLRLLGMFFSLREKGL